MLNAENLPRHVAIIMDGNGRWAKKKHLPRVMGHNAGMESMKKIVQVSSDLGIEHLTVYAFSTENWKRSEEEISGIFGLLLKFVESDLNEVHKKNAKINILGDYSILSPKVIDALEQCIFKTRNNTGLHFNIALNYGSRDEITRAVIEIAEDVKSGKIAPEDITEAMISKHLYTGKEFIPDPDLVIRPGAEVRLSNFLLWQSAYSELYFCDVLWPDFTPKIYEEILEEYAHRKRNFGGRK